MTIVIKFMFYCTIRITLLFKLFFVIDVYIVMIILFVIQLDFGDNKSAV